MQKYSIKLKSCKQQVARLLKIQEKKEKREETELFIYNPDKKGNWERSEDWIEIFYCIAPIVLL